MKSEAGYILIIMVVIICVITYATIILVNHTIDASFLAVRRSETVPAFSLAESAALEGFWQLLKNPAYRATQPRYWNDGWYNYSIIDATPGEVADLNLEVLGQGYVNKRRSRVRLVLIRPNLNAKFTIAAWKEEH